MGWLSKCSLPTQYILHILTFVCSFRADNNARILSLQWKRGRSNSCSQRALTPREILSRGAHPQELLSPSVLQALPLTIPCETWRYAGAEGSK